MRNHNPTKCRNSPRVICFCPAIFCLFCNTYLRTTPLHATRKFLCAALSAALVFSNFILNPILENNDSNLCAEEQQRQQEEQHEKFERMNNKNDNSSLLSFTIIGFPKTGTTFLLNWIHCHPMICSLEGQMRPKKQDMVRTRSSTYEFLLLPTPTSQSLSTLASGRGFRPWHDVSFCDSFLLQLMAVVDGADEPAFSLEKQP